MQRDHQFLAQLEWDFTNLIQFGESDTIYQPVGNGMSIEVAGHISEDN